MEVLRGLVEVIETKKIKKYLHPFRTVAADEQLEPFSQLSFSKQALDRAELAVFQHKCVQRATNASEVDDIRVSKPKIVLCFDGV